MPREHLTSLPGTPWHVWRSALLRSAGFPAGGMSRFAAPALAEAADRHLRGDGDAAEFTAAFDAAAADLGQAVYDIACDDAFRTALTWQNPAVLLAVVGLVAAPADQRRRVVFLSVVVGMEFLVGSAVLLRWLVETFPGVAGVRHPPQIAGLAVPPILGLAAVGLERVLRLDWPSLRLEPAGGGRGRPRLSDLHDRPARPERGVRVRSHSVRHDRRVSSQARCRRHRT